MSAFGSKRQRGEWREVGGFLPSVVTPAKAGSQGGRHRTWRLWAPAFAGVTTMAEMGRKRDGFFPDARESCRVAGGFSRRLNTYAGRR